MNAPIKWHLSVDFAAPGIKDMEAFVAGLRGERLRPAGRFEDYGRGVDLARYILSEAAKVVKRSTTTKDGAQ